MNAIDLQLLIPIALGALYGLRRGFIVGSLDLLGLVISLSAAFAGFGLIADWVRPNVDWPPWVINLAGFGAMLIGVQLIFGLFFVPQAFRARRLLTRVPGVKLADTVGGMAPGAVKGLILTAMIVLALGVWPIVPPARTELGKSGIGRFILPIAGFAEPVAAELVGKLELPLPAAITGGPNDSFSIPVATRIESDTVSEGEMLLLLNAERTRFGLQPLTIDTGLSAVARKYSEEQFLSGVLSHKSTLSGTLADRLKAGNVTYGAAGENLAYAPTAQTAHAGLMSSEGHRANILSPKFNRVGIGIAYSPGFGRVFTQDFAD